MAGNEIFLGTRTFRKMRDDKTYIDKTGFISEFLSGARAEVSLITRPRRFGKSLLLNMLMEFFDIRKDSRELFEGLAISKDKDICSKWMNKYPVIYLSLNEIKSESFEDSYGCFETVASKLCGQYDYLLNSHKVNKSNKIVLDAVQSYTAKTGMLRGLISILCEAIYQDCGKKPVILIDEYDAPLSKIKGENDYNKMKSFIESLFETGFKCNDYFEFAILTGCLRITKENFFTGLNSFKCFGINDNRFSDKFGFTHEEVQELLTEKGFSEKMGMLKEWYDGYCFGSNQSIYCPWDVMQYLFDLEDSQNAQPKTYWKNTSSNDVVEFFLDNYMEKLDDKITVLLNRGCIEADIKEDLTYKNLYDTEENLWTLLYLTGYLTKMPDTHGDADTLLELRIPNKEIFEIFTQTIESAFRKKIEGNENLDLLFDAFWKRDDEQVTEILSDVFLTTLSFHDYYEVYYHAFLAGICRAKYPHTTSNYESGLGRADIIVRDIANKRAAVIELKKPSNAPKENLSSAADRALQQIADMKYDTPLHRDYPVIQHILHWGIACQNKSCVAKSVVG